MGSRWGQLIYALIPQPQHIDPQPVSATALAAGKSCPRAELIAARLASEFKAQIAVTVDVVDQGYPTFDMAEAYRLACAGPHEIRIHADSTWGALRALASAEQLLTQFGELPVGLTLRDAPRFAWRGVLIDVARHFVPLTELKDVLLGMWSLKLNVLHLHLTDDQGFRLRSERYPKLASVDAFGADEIQELVAFAADLGIRVVPELDVPGHVNHWVQAYPELAPLGFSAQSTERFGVHEACLDPTSADVFEFLVQLFAEVSQWFADDFIHIGGDEVHPAWWQQSESIQQYAQAHQLLGKGDLQNAFNGRLCAALADQGKRVVGWDEVLHPQMPQLVVQNWRGATTRDRALRANCDCLVSAGFYLDLFYPAEFHYRYDPEMRQSALLSLEDEWQGDLRMAHVAQGVEWTKQWRQDAVEIEETSAPTVVANVLGGEACLWGELVDAQTLPTRLWSRLPAIAERLWSPETVHDLDDFYRRLNQVLKMPQFALPTATSSAQEITDSRVVRDLNRAGLTAAQVEIVLLLEPVKWYARLLGREALEARLSGAEMPQARPYQAHTPLDRVVDFLSPESLIARDFHTMPRAQLRQHVQRWQLLEASNWPHELREVIVHMRKIGAQMLGYLDAQQDQQSVRDELIQLYAPCGEYLPAVVPALIGWLDAQP